MEKIVARVKDEYGEIHSVNVESIQVEGLQAYTLPMVKSDIILSINKVSHEDNVYYIEKLSGEYKILPSYIFE